jgi:hypothetical protein
VTEEEMRSVIAAIRAAVGSVRWLMPLALPVARLPGVLPLLNDEMVQVKLFGVLRTVEDMSQEAKERLDAVCGQPGSERAKDAVRKVEPQLQELVAAILRAAEAADRRIGPMVRPAYRRVKTAAAKTAGQAAGAAGGAGRKVAERLPTPLRDAGRSAAGVAARTPQALRRAGPAAARAARRTPKTARRMVTGEDTEGAREP